MSSDIKIKTYTFEELQNLTISDLRKIKAAKQELLYDLIQRKNEAIANILYLQKLFKEEVQ